MNHYLGILSDIGQDMLRRIIFKEQYFHRIEDLPVARSVGQKFRYLKTSNRNIKISNHSPTHPTPHGSSINQQPRFILYHYSWYESDKMPVVERTRPHLVVFHCKYLERWLPHA